MANNIIDQGVMTKLGNDSYIVINPKDLDKTVAMLNQHVPKRFGAPIDYNMHTIMMGDQRVLALSSANPKFYFGIGENGLLHGKVNHLLASADGGFVNAKSIEGIAKQAGHLGLHVSALTRAGNAMSSFARRLGLLPSIVVAGGTALTALATGSSPGEAAQHGVNALPGATIPAAIKEGRTTEATYRSYEATGIGIVGTEPVRVANDITKAVTGSGFADLDPGLTTNVVKATNEAVRHAFQKTKSSGDPLP